MGRVEPEFFLAGEARAPLLAAFAPRTKSVSGRLSASANIESYAREFCQAEMIGKLSAQGRARLDAHRQAGHQLILVTVRLIF